MVASMIYLFPELTDIVKAVGPPLVLCSFPCSIPNSYFLDVYLPFLPCICMRPSTLAVTGIVALL